MSCAEIALDHTVPIPLVRSRPAGSAARPARRSARQSARRWSNRWWAWLAASAVVYPGGGIVHLLTTLPEDD
jgi:hypothetical protein